MTNDKLVELTRLGFAARGLLYLVIAWLVIRAGRAEDLSGALEYLAEGSGRLLLIGIGAGFVAYGIWRLADAALNTEGHGSDNKAAVMRAGAAASGFVYLLLAYQAYQLIRGSGGGSGGGAQEQAQDVLQLPGGALLLGIGAAILLVAGIWQLIKAAKATFLKHLSPQVANEGWIKLFGRAGYGARGVIFVVVAFFIAEAALSGSSADAGGMEEALGWFSGPVATLMAIGLALFGIFSLVEARYRVINGPHVDRFS